MVSKKHHRRYDIEFKARAIKLYYHSEKSYKQLSEELGIPEATLASWVLKDKQKQPASNPKSTQAEDVDFNKELMKLKRELADIKEERDILKKALAIFSTDDQKD